MADYVPTEEEREHILLLERFGDHLKQWRSARSTEERAKARSTINRLVDRVQEIVNLAGCRQTMTIAPPPAVGGLVMQNVDPFNYMFENVYGRDLNGHVYDML